MTGLGHVEPGGPSLTFDLGQGMSLTKVSVGSMDNNAYLLRSGGASMLIDAAAEPTRLLAEIGDQPPQTVVTTHRHGDHWQALADVAASTRARLIAGRPDADAIASGASVADLNGVWDGDQMALGDESLEVIGLVGHTPGSIALVLQDRNGTTHLFTGDSLFPGGPGRTTNPRSFESLMDDLETKVFARFDDATVVHPGHGDDTTLGAERPHLAEWRARGW
ncbi:MAG: MBL-fold metallo-hydrolase superfamily [uncultured Propionibacteriaceae bacterium]|uniref:MBL-fold metallo-hydrolase superfamily n=1 Tax=uncultured Propionibacteriaceae bacterium TaxID=257457 RepID=A0A6J4PGL1_9ACTN|nr:MAG: MBL-fold metallo-hydrolase superfamily [uncultured Propionibacteriaceae bacterium]